MTSWAAEELRHVNLGDRRRNERTLVAGGVCKTPLPENHTDNQQRRKSIAGQASISLNPRENRQFPENRIPRRDGQPKCAHPQSLG
jgi:hypothetical protein